MTGLKSILAAAAAFLLIGATNVALAAESGDADSASRVRVSIADSGSAQTADRAVSRSGEEVAQGGGTGGGGAATAGGTVLGTSGAAGEDETSAESAAVVTEDANRDGGGSAATGDSAAGSAPIFLSTGDDTCMGASGVGVQTFEFGFSVGSSWTDADCVMLKNARELSNQGHTGAAKARLCMNEDNAMAFEMTGEPCPRALPSTQAVLDEIRQWNPGYGAAAASAEPGTQIASAAPVSGGSATGVAASGESAETGSRWGTLVAMVTSLLDGAPDAHGPGSLDAVTAMDGVE